MNRQSVLGFVMGLLVGVAVTAVSLTLFKQTRPAAIVIEPPPPPVAAAPTATPGPLQVFVNGAVAAPAVYALPPGSRLEAAVGLAGGFTADADTAVVNLALPLQDGMQIYVPTKTETETNPALAQRLPETAVVITQPESTTGGLVNINTASLAELDGLPGIGPSTAQKIIDYRQSNGLFATIEAIMDVPGIGDAKFAEIQSLITVGN